MAERSVGELLGDFPADESNEILVTVRYFAAARAAAGVPDEQLVVPTGVSAQEVSSAGRSNDVLGTEHRGPGGQTSVGDVLDAATDRHGPGLARVLARCSFLLDEIAVHGRETPVRNGQVLDILPPFAGG